MDRYHSLVRMPLKGGFQRVLGSFSFSRLAPKLQEPQVFREPRMHSRTGTDLEPNIRIPALKWKPTATSAWYTVSRRRIYWNENNRVAYIFPIPVT